MTVTLDTLAMNSAELESSKDAVQKMARFNWLDAGCPGGGQLEFWLQAEREWIEHYYVPSRQFDGMRPQASFPTEGAADGDSCREPEPKKPRRREKAKVR